MTARPRAVGIFADARPEGQQGLRLQSISLQPTGTSHSLRLSSGTHGWRVLVAGTP